MKCIFNTTNSGRISAQLFTPWGEARALPFHQGMDSYEITPLVMLPKLAEQLGVSAIYVKDESKRFGLNAFKGLGCSYAMGAFLCEKADIPVGRAAFSRLCSPETQKKSGSYTFVTATDGNHGRAIAWAAKLLGHRAVVYMPEGSVQERFENIKSFGAEVHILSPNYDDTVRAAAKAADTNGWILVQDMAWPGYEKLPRLIMESYMTLACEITRQLAAHEKPTHLFLQAGVGSMAGAIAAYFSARWGEDCPQIIIVEPDRAECYFRTAQANDGHLHKVTGKLDSIMAGLCCGEVNPLGWEILKNAAAAFISCKDECAVKGMQILGHPEPGDPVIVSGESGAVTAGVLNELMKNPAYAHVKEKLGLDKDSRVLLISTEGDTDQENYRKIMSSQS